ncbi:hypothetical protein KJ641_00945 [Patescibacteria group bacterium]|nr:hypothetical protein [Patescibacteria group bacterium]MBU1895425.1 hypothetical protein [Patescibacteria group bacterium]
MVIGTILCWLSWAVVLFNIDPYSSDIFGFAFFYLSLFLSLVGTISILAFFIHQLFGGELLPMFRYVQKSFRDAMIISVLFVLILLLQGTGVLNIWNFTILIFLVLLTISFTISIKSARKKKLPFDQNFNL